MLLLDLDNTLVDRDAAFRAAVVDFLAQDGLPASDLTWVMAVDAGGYTTRQEVAAALTDRYGGVVPTTTIRALLDTGAADRVVLAQSTREALGKAQAHGWSCVIVTNGRTVQQEAKIRNTGLDQLVQGWVISESVGHKKPEPETTTLHSRFVGVIAGLGTPKTHRRTVRRNTAPDTPTGAVTTAISSPAARPAHTSTPRCCPPSGRCPASISAASG